MDLELASGVVRTSRVDRGRLRVLLCLLEVASRSLTLPTKPLARSISSLLREWLRLLLLLLLPRLGMG